MKLRALLLLAFAGFTGACAKEEVVLLTVDAGGSSSGGAPGAQNGGAAQGGAVQGGAAQLGGAQGGATQGGVAQGGAAQGGTADGGSPFGGAFGGGAGPDGSIPCHNDADCDVSSSCQKLHCGDDHGRCEKLPLLCEADHDAVCGCDNINYWNDCLRRQFGVSLAQKGDCPTPKQCRSSMDCPGFDVGLGQCARLSPNGQCGSGPNIPGSCWIVPESCDPSLDSTRWIDCSSPHCVDTCTAIQVGHPFVKVPSGVCP